MNKTLICSTIGFFIFFACNKTESEEPTPSGLNGKWNVVSIEECGGQGEAYMKGEIIWDFDTITNTVSISNYLSTPSNSLNDFQKKGDYSYELLNDGNQHYMVIYFNELEVHFKDSLIEHVLMLDLRCSLDGMLLLLER